MSSETKPRPRSRVSKPKPNKTKSVDPLPSENTCIICAEPILYSAVSPCNNVTCHLCCFRQRALYGRNTCLVCRTEHPQVVFTDQILQPEAKYVHFEEQSQDLYNEKYGVRFTSEDAQNATMSLLDQKCSVCGETFDTFKKLAEHTRNTHSKEYCSICGSHRKAFVSELKLYTKKQLQKHLNEGDVEGFTGHPKCKFCRNKQFYSEDELNIHIRDHHERCYICDQDAPRLASYYRNYDHLYEHFKESHYVCSIPSCVEKRFVVFREDLDLTAHMLKEHGGIAGHNGKIVMGANYHSQLSTISQNQRARPQAQQDSFDIKRRRLEERAKYYLHNDLDDIAKFSDINQAFRSKRIDASRLISDYELLFKVPESDLSLLIYELAELYPQHSDQRQSLHSVYLSKYPNSTSGTVSPGLNESFPVLGNGSSSNINIQSWASQSSARRNTEELFPRLPKPQKPVTVKKDQPIRYVAMKKPQPKPVVTINSFQGNPSYRPTYLENTRKTPSTSSFPSLNGSAAASNRSSAQSSRSSSPMVSSKSPQLSEKNFPTLTKKVTKKEIPRVKAVSNGNGLWGSGLAQSTPKPTEDFGIPIIDKKAEKLRRKQERAAKK